MGTALADRLDEFDVDFNLKTSRPQVPLPVALGGVGLFLAYFTSRGLAGWQGFLIGFVIGVAVLLYSFFRESRVRVL
jgi:hypothetical protein